jgi:hypothetical protein
VDAPSPARFTRRQLLLAGGAGLVVVGFGGAEVVSRRSKGSGTGPLTLYRVFETEQPVGEQVRLPLALASAAGDLDVPDAPGSITFRLRDPGGGLSAPTTVARRAEGIPRGYYPAVVELSTTGTWSFEVEAAGQHLATDLSALDASELPAVTRVGDPLPRIPTPTTADARSVSPICTREPACPFHEVSLDAALALGRPIVLVVSTPAHCQTAICGPVLDLVIARRATLEAAGATVIHAEVYTDDTTSTTTPTVDALGLTYEPSLFYAGADGVVKAQLGYTFDATELDDRLAPLLA